MHLFRLVPDSNRFHLSQHTELHIFGLLVVAKRLQSINKRGNANSLAVEALMHGLFHDTFRVGTQVVMKHINNQDIDGVGNSIFRSRHGYFGYGLSTDKHPNSRYGTPLVACSASGHINERSVDTSKNAVV